MNKLFLSDKNKTSLNEKRILAEKTEVVLNRCGAIWEMIRDCYLFWIYICRLTVVNFNVSVQEYHVCFWFYLKRIFISFFSHCSRYTYILFRCFVIFVSLKEKVVYMCWNLWKLPEDIYFKPKVFGDHVGGQRVMTTYRGRALVRITMLQSKTYSWMGDRRELRSDEQELD